LVSDHGPPQRKRYHIGGRTFSLQAAGTQAAVILDVAALPHSYLHYVADVTAADPALGPAIEAKVQFRMMLHCLTLTLLGIHIIAVKQHSEIVLN
jgi:hypothetical protein